METGITNKPPRTSPTTKSTTDKAHQKAICDNLRSSPIRGSSVRSMSDLSLNPKHNNKGTNNSEMGMNGTNCGNGTSALGVEYAANINIASGGAIRCGYAGGGGFEIFAP